MQPLLEEQSSPEPSAPADPPRRARWFIVGANRVYGVPAAAVPERFSAEPLTRRALRDLR